MASTFFSLSAAARQPGPACQSEGSGNASLMDVAMGLRAVLRGEMPEEKPAAPAVITKTLPQSGPRDHVARRAREIKGARLVSLARCEEQAWAEIQFKASNSRIWAEARALKGMFDAVDSFEHSANAAQKSTG